MTTGKCDYNDEIAGERMMVDFQQDKLSDLITAYYKKLGDYPPRHALHGIDPEDALRKAIKNGKLIPEVLPGNTIRDTQ